ncbi:glycosyltransferase family 4 protein [Solitalea canadensis]|nr:glycosyltransferase family 4 protein [Solitalea canadensis]
MRIAQIAPLYEATPPLKYGGTERVVSYLTEELVRQGHEVTLFASGDSITNAELISCSPKSLRTDNSCIDPLARHYVMLQKVAEQSERFDMLHFHIDYLHFPFSVNNNYKHLSTLHGRLDLPDLKPLYEQFSYVPVVSISDHQRKPLPFAGWVETVYHGIPADLHTIGNGGGNYLAFLGRISPEKRVDRAIEIAKRVGMKIKIAAKIDKVDEEYFNKNIFPLLDHPLVEFIGEITEIEKRNFLRDAVALLFPIDWPEPFGMVMIESMAAGTPVIAFNKGSVPEIIDNGLTGFIVENVDDAVKAVNALPTLSRAECRKVFEHRFSAERMANQYLSIYCRLIENKNPINRTNQQQILNSLKSNINVCG